VITAYGHSLGNAIASRGHVAIPFLGEDTGPGHAILQNLPWPSIPKRYVERLTAGRAPGDLTIQKGFGCLPCWQSHRSNALEP